MKIRKCSKRSDEDQKMMKRPFHFQFPRLRLPFLSPTHPNAPVDIYQSTIKEEKDVMDWDGLKPGRGEYKAPYSANQQKIQKNNQQPKNRNLLQPSALP